MHARCAARGRRRARALRLPSEYQARNREIASRIPPTTAISSPRSICLKFIGAEPNRPDRCSRTVARFAAPMDFRQLLPAPRTVDELELLAELRVRPAPEDRPYVAVNFVTVGRRPRHVRRSLRRRSATTATGRCSMGCASSSTPCWRARTRSVIEALRADPRPARAAGAAASRRPAGGAARLPDQPQRRAAGGPAAARRAGGPGGAVHRGRAARRARLARTGRSRPPRRRRADPDAGCSASWPRAVRRSLAALRRRPGACSPHCCRGRPGRRAVPHAGAGPHRRRRRSRAHHRSRARHAGSHAPALAARARRRRSTCATRIER